MLPSLVGAEMGPHSWFLLTFPFFRSHEMASSEGDFNRLCPDSA